MITTLVLYVCTSTALDDCQAYAYHQWNGRYQLEACLASVDPTLDALRRQGLQYVAATCEESEE